jgi:hypothetical protein
MSAATEFEIKAAEAARVAFKIRRGEYAELVYEILRVRLPTDLDSHVAEAIVSVLEPYLDGLKP